MPPHDPGKVSQYDNFILTGIGSAIKHMDTQGIELVDRGKLKEYYQVDGQISMFQ